MDACRLRARVRTLAFLLCCMLLAGMLWGREAHRIPRFDEGILVDGVIDEAAWAEVWAASDIIIEGDPLAQQAVRHSLFQILIATPRHDSRVSVSAKTLSGFGYR